MSSARGPRSVSWSWLELSGFGVHDGRRFEFPAGLGSYVAPNETGKSTAVAGLTAVVFGLPASSDPNAWGQSRFRSYVSDSRFGGRVAFRAGDGHEYQIERNFDSHEVELRRLGAQPKALYSGKHNPGARKGSGRYEEYLIELFGIAEPELYRTIFSIEQPLAGADTLSADVGRLLAGSGGGTADSALSKLESEIKERTRFTKELGLPGKDKNKDRRLEELRREIEEVRQAIEAARSAADGVHRLQLELTQVEGRVEELAAQAAKVDSKERSTKSWLDAELEYRRKSGELVDLEERVKQAEDYERLVHELQEPGDEEARRGITDWSWCEGSAASHLLQRREDVTEALGQYRRFREVDGRVHLLREEISRHPLLTGLSDEELMRLERGEVEESRLADELDEARSRLEEVDRYITLNDPARGFEDVAGLDDRALEELRLQASARPRGRFVSGLAVAALTAAACWLAGLDVVALAAFAALAGVASALAVHLHWTVRIRPHARDAGRLLDRHDRFEAARAAAPDPPDRGAALARLEAAQGQLSEWRSFLAGFQSAYDDLAGAVAGYRELVRVLERAEREVALLADDYWGCRPDEVTALATTGLKGCWQRSAALLPHLGERPATVVELQETLARLIDYRWEALAQDARNWDIGVAARRKREEALLVNRNRLATVLEAEGVESVEELRRKVGVVRLSALAALKEFQVVCESNPELPAVDEGQEARGRVSELSSGYAARRLELHRLIEGLRADALELRRQIADKQGTRPVNIAELEVELAQLLAESETLAQEVRAYALAHASLDDAIREYQGAYLERLSELATSYFRDFTGRPGRQVRFADGFAVEVFEGDGVEIAPKQLSQGAQDQLALAVRLAVADMISDTVKLPLVLDDPFHNCDDDRLERIRASIAGLATERQVLILSHQPRFEAWGAPVRATSISREARAGQESFVP